MPLSRKRLLTFAVLTEAAALLLALALAYWLEIELTPVPDRPLHELAIALLATIPPVALFAVLVSYYGDTVPLVRGLRNTLLRDVRSIFENAKLPDLCVFAFLAGLAEEALFRGVLQTQLGLIPASVLFGLAHFVTPAYALAATVMGFYIGAVFAASESLFVVILLHGLYDLYALIQIRFYVAHQSPQRAPPKT